MQFEYICINLSASHGAGFALPCSFLFFLLFFVVFVCQSVYVCACVCLRVAVQIMLVGLRVVVYVVFWW